MGICRICENRAFPFLNLGLQPFANKYPGNTKEIINEQKHEMLIEFCETCRSAQISTIIDRSLMFNDYYYLSSVNKELVSHFDEFAENELKNCEFVLDIGSNDGILLRPLKKMGIKAIGIDPSINVGKLANDEGLETIIGFLNSTTTKKIKTEYGMPDAIVASSVFTHIEDPKTFINDVKFLCDDSTSVYIEIEYLGNLIKNLQFERFYFDRPHYYSIKGVETLFLSAGFVLTSVKEIAPHGGSLRLKFNLKTGSVVVDESVSEFLEKEQSLLSENAISSFSSTVNREAKAFVKLLESLKAEGKKVIGYGAPARLATITNYCQIDSSLISFIMEDSPLKIGRKTPGKHIEILSSDKMSEIDFDVLIVFAYEYIDSIKVKTSKFNVPHYKPIPTTLMF